MEAEDFRGASDCSWHAPCVVVGTRESPESIASRQRRTESARYSLPLLHLNWPGGDSANFSVEIGHAIE